MEVREKVRSVGWMAVVVRREGLVGWMWTGLLGPRGTGSGARDAAWVGPGEWAGVEAAGT